MVQAPPRDVIEAWVVYVRGGLTALHAYVADASTFVAHEAQYAIAAKGSSIMTYLLGAQHINNLVADGLNLTGDERPRGLLDGGLLKLRSLHTAHCTRMVLVRAGGVRGLHEPLRQGVRRSVGGPMRR